MIRALLLFCVLSPVLAWAGVEVVTDSSSYRITEDFISSEQEPGSSYWLYDLRNNRIVVVGRDRQSGRERSIRKAASVDRERLKKYGVRFKKTGEGSMLGFATEIFDIYSGAKLCAELHVSREIQKEFPELNVFYSVVRSSSLMGLRVEPGTDVACKAITGMVANMTRDIGAPLKVHDKIKNDKLQDKSIEIQSVNRKSFEQGIFDLPPGFGNEE